MTTRDAELAAFLRAVAEVLRGWGYRVRVGKRSLRCSPGLRLKRVLPVP